MSALYSLDSDTKHGLLGVTPYVISQNHLTNTSEKFEPGPPGSKSDSDIAEKVTFPHYFTVDVK